MRSSLPVLISPCWPLQHVQKTTNNGVTNGMHALLSCDLKQTSIHCPLFVPFVRSLDGLLLNGRGRFDLNGAR